MRTRNKTKRDIFNARVLLAPHHLSRPFLFDFDFFRITRAPSSAGRPHACSFLGGREVSKLSRKVRKRWA